MQYCELSGAVAGMFCLQRMAAHIISACHPCGVVASTGHAEKPQRQTAVVQAYVLPLTCHTNFLLLFVNCLCLSITSC
jgi:hypothetical protein